VICTDSTWVQHVHGPKIFGPARNFQAILQPGPARPADIFANVRHYRIGCFSEVGFVVIHILYNRSWFITHFCSLQSSSIRRSATDHSKLTWPNYLLIAAKIFKSAGRQTTARPGPARPAGRVGPVLISSATAPGEIPGEIVLARQYFYPLELNKLFVRNVLRYGL